MSTRLAVCLCISVLSLSAFARQTLPKDVAQSVEEHDACDHARGDAAPRALQKFCKGSDKHLSQLKQQDPDEPVVVQRLSKVEPGQHGSHGTPAASAMHNVGHPANAEPGDVVMIDPDP